MPGRAALAPDWVQEMGRPSRTGPFSWLLANSLAWYAEFGDTCFVDLVQKLKVFEVILIGLLVAVIGTFMVPAFFGTTSCGPETEMPSNGKSIYISIFREVSQGRETWPSSTQFTSSTEVFQYLIDKEVMNVDGTFFGMRRYRSDDHVPERVYASNNVWNVVADVGDSPDTTPLLISANAPLSRLDQPITVDDLTDLYPGKEHVFVVFKNGAVERFHGAEVTELFDRVANTNIVLRP